ncbi:MAG: outer membrane protein assembly factor BamB, partial [Chromatiales bacterium]|nr:outer membrane protein assembly factor BamB [Chromatiales bacterium]
MRQIVTAPALLLLTVLGGCTAVGDYMLGTDNNEPPAVLEPVPDSIAIETIWERDIGEGGGRGGVGLIPMLYEEHVYAAEAGGDVVALNAASGASIWSTETDIRVTGGPGVGEGLVVVGSEDGEVVALLAQDGSIVWRTTVTSEVLTTPRIAEGVVIIRTVDGKLFGLEAETGTQRWTYDRSVPVLSLRGTAAPAIDRGLAIGGFDSGRLVAVSIEDGQTVWESRIAVPSGRTELERLVDIDAEPLIVDGIVYAVTYQGRIAAIDVISGEVEWRRDMSSHAGIGVDEDAVYVTDATGHIWSLERSSSASSWRQKKLENRRATAPRRFDEYVVVGDLEGYVHWLRREDGQFAARL